MTVYVCAGCGNHFATNADDTVADCPFQGCDGAVGEYDSEGEKYRA